MDDTVGSVLSQTYTDFEVIIVNDGSTDKHTIKWLEEYLHEKVQIIHIKNQGPAAAINAGIKESKGTHIVVLDADDKLAPAFIEKTKRIMDERPDVRIVYTDALLFGVERGFWHVKDYSFPDILEDNVLNTIMFKKQDWQVVGGYCEEMINGWQDYEFFLSLIDLGGEVYKIPEVLFYYRIRKGGIHLQISGTTKYFVSNKMKIYKNHKKMYAQNMDYIYENYVNLRKGYRELVYKYEKDVKFLRFFSFLLPYFVLKKIVSVISKFVKK